MNEDEVIQKIKDVLKSFGCEKFECYKYDDTSTMVQGGAMYDRPPNLDACVPQLSEIIGGSEVLLDPVSSAGCETCDYGSQYGTDFLFRNATFIPTKNHSGEIE